ncbi:MAG: elongation factor G [Gemmataceae bacterium]
MAGPKTNTDLSKFRNLGIIAHIDAGKTTTTEHILYYAGAKHKLGEVDAGTTETDYDPEEQQRGITIYSACIPFQWRDCTINLIDTPGHVDFTAEVERSLRVLDGAVVVFDAQKGVEAQSETVWRQADKYGVPRMVFVNKMDVVGANFANALAEIVERLEGRPVPLLIPIGAGSPKDSATPFAGVIDLITGEALYFDAGDYGRTIRRAPIPAEQEEEYRTYRDQMFDALTAHDEKDIITSLLLEGHSAPAEKVKALVRDLTIRKLIHPVLCGSGREHIGIQPLLDAVVDYLPNPLDRPPVQGSHPKKDKVETRKPDPKEPFCGLVFKVVVDAHNELAFVRVYSGILKPNSRPYNPGKDAKELVGKLYHVHADPKVGREEVLEAIAGDIVALVGLKESQTGDTLCDAQHPILLEPISFAEAVVSQSIEPESSADKQKLIDTLTILHKEDPTFQWKHDAETGQTVMSGMGMLHLEVKRHRMDRDFRLKARVGKPRVSYRETLKKPIKVTGEFNKQGAGGQGMFARLTVEFRAERGTGLKVAHRLKPDALPANFLAAGERGVHMALQSGAMGYPVLDVQAQILGGEVDAVLSNEIAFEAAGAAAVQMAYQDNMVLLEPIMKLDVSVPDEFYGNVTADLNARRAEIQATHPHGKWWTITATVPLAKMFDYADRLRSLSQGRASSTMAPHSYAAAPDDIQRQFYLGEEI